MGNQCCVDFAANANGGPCRGAPRHPNAESARFLHFLRGTGGCEAGLLKSGGGRVKLEALAAAGGPRAVIGLYFSGRWSSPCCGFTRELARCYHALKAGGRPFEIVCVSWDRDEEAFQEHFAEMPWLAIPFPERGLAKDLGADFQVKEVPALVLLQPGGAVITTDGRRAVGLGHEFFPWGEEDMRRAEAGKLKALRAEAAEMERQAQAGGPALARLRGPPGSATLQLESRRISFTRLATVGALDSLATAGVLYYEVELLDAEGAASLGFAASAGAVRVGGEEHGGGGVGDDNESWGVDGARGALRHNGVKAWRSAWVAGDVIGLAANVSLGKIAISINGNWVGDPYGVVFMSEKIKAGVYPCLSAERCSVGFNLDGMTHGAFRYGPPPDRVWNSMGKATTLTEYLLEYYLKGGVFRHDGPDGFDEEWFRDGVPVLRHRASGICVWADLIDLRRSSELLSVVVYHYTSEASFLSITDPAREAAELWASLSRELSVAGALHSWYGRGVYGTSKSPADFRTWRDVVDNNLRRAADRHGPQDYEGRVKFCIPLLVSVSEAYDVSVRETPEMALNGHGPGRDVDGSALNEPGRPRRDYWVVRASRADAAEGARARVEEVARERHRWVTERFGAGSAEALRTEDALGKLLHLRGKHGEAEPLLRHVAEVRECAHGAEHQSALASANNLAAVLHLLGRYSEAEPLYRRTLKVGEAVLGAEHQVTLTSAHSLGVLLEQMGRHSEAEVLYRRALDARERAHGAEHPDTLSSVSSLAALLAVMGQHSEAELLYRRALEAHERTLGVDHLDTLCSLGGLAALLKAMGRYSEAEPLYRHALAVKERKLGAEHPSTMTSVNNLAVLLDDLGCHSEAEPLCRRALAVHERTLGSEHSDTLRSLNNLAALLSATGRGAEAEPLSRRAAEAMERTLGAEHPSTLTALHNLAALLQSLGRYAEAEPLCRRALEGRGRALGAEHPDALCSVGSLAALLSAAGRWSEAEPLFRRALETSERALGPEHAGTVQARSSLARFLEKGGRDAEARGVREAGLKASL